MCLSCEIPWKARVRFVTVPTDPKQQAIMEAQLREAYMVPSIYDPISWGPKGATVCAIFAKDKLTPADLDVLNDTGRALFAPYPGPVPA